MKINVAITLVSPCLHDVGAACFVVILVHVLVYFLLCTLYVVSARRTMQTLDVETCYFRATLKHSGQTCIVFLVVT